MYRFSLNLSVIRLQISASDVTRCCHRIQRSCNHVSSWCNTTFPIALSHLCQICWVRISLSKISTSTFYSSMTFPTLPHSVFHETVNRFILNNLFLLPLNGAVVSVLHFLLAVGNVHPVGPGQIRWWNIHFIWHLLSSYFPCSHSYSQSFTVTDRRDLPFHFSRLSSSPYICILFRCATSHYACLHVKLQQTLYVHICISKHFLYPEWLRCVDPVFHRNSSFRYKFLLATHSPAVLIFLKQHP